MTPSKITERDQALTLLTTFCRRILPSALRRIARWRGIALPTITDFADDIRQELAVDCLEHAAVVVSLSPMQRHARWMRRADQWVYRQRRLRNQGTELPDDVPAPGGQQALRHTEPDLVTLANGRMNVVRSANQQGTAVRRLRQQMEELAFELGCDDDYDRFWQWRLAEAMTGLAADLMRTQVNLRLLGRRPLPRPAVRLQRLRRISARFQVRPSTLIVRRLLQPWLRRFEDDADAPRRLLEHAVQLWPGNPAAWLWLFEVHCARWDLAAAARVLRSCRQQATPSRCALTLARARLLEVRERWSAAMHLLRRALRRWPFEAKLRQVLTNLTSSPGAAQG